MRTAKKIIIPVMLISVAAAAFAAVPQMRKILFAAEPAKLADVQPVADDKKIYSKDEMGLFDEMAAIYNRVGNMTSYLVEGSLQMTDPVDTSNSMQTNFRYCRQDSLVYYQFGEQEIISVPGLSFTVNHMVRKIFVSEHADKVSGIRALIDSKQLEMLRGENFDISKEDVSPYTAIRLKGDRHFSIREYRLTYDTAGYVRRVFTRNKSMDEPANPALDRIMLLSFRTWQTDHLPAQLFNVSRYMQKTQEGWKPVSAFENYDIKYID